MAGDTQVCAQKHTIATVESHRDLAMTPSHTLSLGRIHAVHRRSRVRIIHHWPRLEYRVQGARPAILNLEEAQCSVQVSSSS